MADTPRELTEVVSELAQTLGRDTGPTEMLALILHGAVDVILVADSASVTVTTDDGKVETVASTSDLATSADQAQYDLGEGPCLEAATNQEILLAYDLHGQTPWPMYAPAAVALGFGSQVAFRFSAGPDRSPVRGGLNVYSRQRGSIDTETIEAAGIFAALVGTAMGWSQRRQQYDEALASRTLIGQATGIIMERYTLDPVRAFGFLSRLSQNKNIKIRALSQQFVDEATAKTALT